MCMTGGEEGTEIGDDDRGSEGVAVGFCKLLTFSLDETVRIEVGSTESFIRRRPASTRHLAYQKVEASLVSLPLLDCDGLVLCWVL